MNLFIHIFLYAGVTTFNLITADMYFGQSLLLSALCIAPLVTIIHLAMAAVDWIFRITNKLSFWIYFLNATATITTLVFLLFFRHEIDAGDDDELWWKENTR